MISSGPTLSGEQILLVDDDSVSLQVLVATLEGCGYRLLVASNGVNALQILERVQPALILLDVLMPDMDGFEVCRLIKANPKLASIPVIFLSGLDHSADKVRGLQMGAVDFVTKPYQPDEVIARVSTQVKLARLKRELEYKNRQLRNTNRHILEAMREGLLAIDQQGMVRYVNPAVEALTGWRREEVEGLPFTSQRMFAGDAALDEMLRVTLIEGGGHRARDCRFRKRDGSVMEVECSISPVADAAGHGGVLVFKDVTDRKQAERELQRIHLDLEQSHRELREAQEQLIRAARLETVGQLAAGVAHEVKNPLAVVQFGVDYLNQVVDKNAAVVEVLEEMQGAVGRADHIIKGLLDFSRYQQPQMSAEDLNDLLRDSVSLIDHELQLHAITLELALSVAPLPVMADREMIRQVMINLIMNAVQAIGEDGTITLRSWSGEWQEQRGIWNGAFESFGVNDKVCCCAVDDSGSGIKADNVERVFDPFFTTKPVGEGTGLGLSVTANIIDLHGALISLTNRDGAGACAQLVFKQASGEL